MTNDEAHALASYTPTLDDLATCKAVLAWVERETDNALVAKEPAPNLYWPPEDTVDWAWDRYCRRDKDRMEREARG